jgi:imidazolonepropionase-like amidohydrolase
MSAFRDIRPTESFAWAAERVFDGTGVLRDHAVVVRGGLVVAVLPRPSLTAGMQVFSERGTTLIPGLIDTHVHFMRWEAPLFLAYGVTTIRDTGNEPAWILERRDRAAEEGSPGILCQGAIIDGPEPGHRVVSRRCATMEQAVAAVREMARAGTDGVKLYHNLERDWLAAVADEAHSFGLKASMHCLQTGVLAAAEAGVDEFFHLDGVLTDVWPDHPPGWLDSWGLPGWAGTEAMQDREADGIAARGMTATPTLVYWESQRVIRTTAEMPSAASAVLPARMLEWQASEPADAPSAERWRRALEAAQGFLRTLLQRGVPVLAGTDVPFGALIPGRSLWRELQLITECGMSPVGALQAATSAAASFLGRPSLGRLAPGAAADFVVIRGDPTTGIPVEPDIVAVAHDGIVQTPRQLFDRAKREASSAEGDPWSDQFSIHRELRNRKKQESRLTRM